VCIIAECHQLIGRIRVVYLQSIDELDISSFRYGGVNITGFRLIDSDDVIVQAALRDWKKLDPAIWNGAGPDSKLTVRRWALCFCPLICTL